jgi:hypothetical protein
LQSLAHRIKLLLHSLIISPTPAPTTTHHFDPITQWLPKLCLTVPPTPTDDDPTHETDNPIPNDDYPIDNISFVCDNHDSNEDPPAPTPAVPQQHPLPIVQPIIPLQAPPITMDISKIYTQNAHGLWCQVRNCEGNIIANCQRDTTKLEHLVHQMRVNDIDAWLVQETWLEDNDFNTDIGGYHLFRHNSPVGTTERNHLFHGVAIILSPRYFLAWKAAGSPSPITTGSTGDFAGRFIGLNLKFNCFDSLGRQVKRKSLSLFLASVYHPCHDAPHKQFLKTLSLILQKVPKNSNLIIGADINAKVG